MKYGIVFVVGAALVTSACGNRYFADPVTNPTPEQYVNHGDGGFAVLSTAPHLRSTFIRLDPKGETGSRCSEPPADAAQAVASALSLGAKSGEISVDYANKVATAIQPLLYRSQGLQMNRDNMAALCMLRENGWIKPDELVPLMKLFSSQANDLAKLEIEKKPGFSVPASIKMSLIPTEDSAAKPAAGATTDKNAASGTKPPN